MKKAIAAVILALAPLAAVAEGAMFNGVLHGNICRTGPVYAFIAWAPVGSQCWNYIAGNIGVVSTY